MIEVMADLKSILEEGTVGCRVQLFFLCFDTSKKKFSFCAKELAQVVKNFIFESTITRPHIYTQMFHITVDKQILNFCCTVQNYSQSEWVKLPQLLLLFSWWKLASFSKKSLKYGCKTKPVVCIFLYFALIQTEAVMRNRKNIMHFPTAVRQIPPCPPSCSVWSQ